MYNRWMVHKNYGEMIMCEHVFVWAPILLGKLHKQVITFEEQLIKKISHLQKMIKYVSHISNVVSYTIYSTPKQFNPLHALQ